MKQDHIFFDLETSSLDPFTGEIIEIAAIRTDSLGQVSAACVNKVKFSGEIDEEAAKVNGYNERDWKNAIPLRTALDSIYQTVIKDRSDKYVVVAYAGEFDRQFLTNSCKKHELDFPFPKRAWVDPMHMAWVLVYNNAIDSRKLTSLANYYGVDITGAHSADGDCRILMDVYFNMMRRFAIGQKVENFGRTLVNKATQSVLEKVQNFGKTV